MKNLFGNISSKVNDMMNDDTSLLSQAKKKLEEQQIEVPISSEMILYIIKKQELEGISNLDVEITDHSMVISGIAKKMLMSIHFSVELKPRSASGRTIIFEVEDMKPLNQDWIKKSVFNKPPVLSYDNNSISININEIEKVRKIPVGKIKEFTIKENKLRVNLGV